MIPITGHYCLIQYCPDQSRLEAANVGVLLFVPERQYLKAMTARDNHRVQQFFGRGNQDLTRLNTYKRGMEHRIDTERPSVHTLADLEQFIATRVNVLRITPPRPMLVTDPDTDLKNLFDELVADNVTTKKTKTLKTILRDKFHEANLDDRIETDVPIHIEQFGKDVTIPFGYQNGRFQLIQPARFEAEDLDHILRTASYYAMEGESLYGQTDAKRGQLQLTVVGQFPFKGSENRDRVRRILKTKNVRLFAAEEVDKLVDDMVANAKRLGEGHKALS